MLSHEERPLVGRRAWWLKNVPVGVEGRVIFGTANYEHTSGVSVSTTLYQQCTNTSEAMALVFTGTYTRVRLAKSQKA